MCSIEVALEEFSVLFLYSCILMSLLQVKIKKNSSGDFGFFKKLSSHSRINSSSSITTSKQLFRRKVLASLKVGIFVCERNIAVAFPSENCLLLSVFSLAGTTGLDLVFLIHPRRRPGSPSSYLKVNAKENVLTQAVILYTPKGVKSFGALALATPLIVVDSKPSLFASQTIFTSTAIYRKMN